MASDKREPHTVTVGATSVPPLDVPSVASTHRPFDAFRLICSLSVGVGVLLRLYSGSALWLDEALSVNISALPIGELFSALRHDGSPPLYYLSLHAWVELFGSSDLAVRSLSTLASLAALPIGYLVGRRLEGRFGGPAVLVLMATNPFLIRYATETRMYSLVVLLVLIGTLTTLRAVERPTFGRLWPVALVAGALSLTHYWTIFLAVLAITTLAFLGLRADRPAACWRSAAAIIAGQLLFLPWVPAFLFQLRNTGTPWAPSARLTDLLLAVRDWSGGPEWFAWPLALALVVLMVVALRRSHGADDGRAASAQRAVRALSACAIGALILGLLSSGVAHAGYASRYTSPSIALVLLLSGVGLSRLRPSHRRLVSALIAVSSIAICITNVVHDDRTQARDTAALLAKLASPADVVVYCPDQLGPAVSRELADSGAVIPQLVYPTLGSPERVDWVGYAARNAAADPAVIAEQITQRTTGTVWLVMRPGYLTFGTQCEQLAAALVRLRGSAHVVQQAQTRYFESEEVLQFSVRRAADATGAP